MERFASFGGGALRGVVAGVQEPGGDRRVKATAQFSSESSNADNAWDAISGVSNVNKALGKKKKIITNMHYRYKLFILSNCRMFSNHR